MQPSMEVDIGPYLHHPHHQRVGVAILVSRRSGQMVQQPISGPFMEEVDNGMLRLLLFVYLKSYI